MNKIETNMNMKTITITNDFVCYQQDRIGKEIIIAIDELLEENKELKELYKKTCKHLFDIGNDELARYFKAQIDENNTFMVGDM